MITNISIANRITSKTTKLVIPTKTQRFSEFDIKYDHKDTFYNSKCQTTLKLVEAACFVSTASHLLHGEEDTSSTLLNIKAMSGRVFVVDKELDREVYRPSTHEIPLWKTCMINSMMAKTQRKNEVLAPNEKEVYKSSHERQQCLDFLTLSLTKLEPVIRYQIVHPRSVPAVRQRWYTKPGREKQTWNIDAIWKKSLGSRGLRKCWSMNDLSKNMKSPNDNNMYHSIMNTSQSDNPEFRSTIRPNRVY